MGFSSRGLKSLTSVDVIEFYRQTTPHSEIIMDSCILVSVWIPTQVCLNIDISDVGYENSLCYSSILPAYSSWSNDPSLSPLTGDNIRTLFAGSFFSLREKKNEDKIPLSFGYKISYQPHNKSSSFVGRKKAWKSSVGIDTKNVSCNNEICQCLSYLWAQSISQTKPR